MTRRPTQNKTGIDRIPIPNGNVHDAWVVYTCVKCRTVNYVNIGHNLIDPNYAYENFAWECEKCGFVHSKNADLPDDWTNWQSGLLEREELTVQRFWQGFFRSCTENPESYWKQCNVCGRILPNSAFSKHTGFGPLAKQMECRACKGAINAVLNDKRTPEQLREASIRRRVADLMVQDYNEKLDIDALFERFGSKCFKTGQHLDIKKTGSWNIDHILPSKYLYPLTKENSALLSRSANSNKREKWPSEFYTPQELVELAKITGADLALLSSPEPIINTKIDVNGGVDRYLKVRNSNQNIPKLVDELKKVLQQYNIIYLLDEEHKSILGL